MKQLITLAALAAAAMTASAQHSIYIENRTDWDEVCLYAWATGEEEILGGWPGATPTESVVINEVTYLKFDTPASADGKTYNFIANNNNNNKQMDVASLVLDKDYYYAINGTSAVEVDPENPGGDIPEPTYETYKIYVDNQTGWDALKIYAWGTGVPELFGGWPGAAASSTETVDGVEYAVFDMTGNGNAYNLIFNNDNNGTQFDGPSITANRDYWFKVTADACEEIAAPGKSEYHIYVDDQTGWDAFYIYGWGTDLPEIFGGWPGQQANSTETIDGTEYKVFNMIGSGEEYNLIFNNDDGTQYDAAVITVDKDYYFTATATGISTSLTITAENEGSTVYFDLTGNRVAQPKNGLYIKVSAGKATKVIMK